MEEKKKINVDVCNSGHVVSAAELVSLLFLLLFLLLSLWFPCAVAKKLTQYPQFSQCCVVHKHHHSKQASSEDQWKVEELRSEYNQMTNVFIILLPLSYIGDILAHTVDCDGV